MSMIRPIFGSARVRIMQIAYYCDVADDSGPVIPLGVMTDTAVGRMRGLGLRARVALSDQELALIGVQMRPLLVAPFKMLLNEFNRIWKSADPAASFGDMPEKRHGSLRFELQPTSRLPIPRALASQYDQNSDALMVWTKEQLTAACLKGYWALLDRHFAAEAVPQDGNVKEKVAA